MTAPTLCGGVLAIPLSLFIVVYSQRTCPSQCSCSIDPASRQGIIDCSNRGLTFIPDLDHPSAGSYARIDLSNNQLTTLDVDQVFKLIGSASVDVLDFSSNMISSVSGTFDGNDGKDYETLNLANNLFTTFPENVIPLTHRRSNLILDFSNNRLTELSRYMFAGGNDPFLFGFQFLASNNMISQVHDEAFQGVTLVDVVLDLRFNRLNSLSPTFQQPGGVREYRFSGNPWNCDCNLRWIINPALAIINRTANDPPNCVKPALLQGLPVFGLKSNEFTCLPFQQGSLTRNIVNQDSFTLSCPASADPPNPEISWTIWLPCPSEDDPLELTFTSDEITLSNIVINPRAAFRCTASNNAGSVNIDLDVRVNGESGINIPGTLEGSVANTGTLKGSVANTRESGFVSTTSARPPFNTLDKAFIGPMSTECACKDTSLSPRVGSVANTGTLKGSVANTKESGLVSTTSARTHLHHQEKESVANTGTLKGSVANARESGFVSTTTAHRPFTTLDSVFFGPMSTECACKDTSLSPGVVSVIIVLVFLTLISWSLTAFTIYRKCECLHKDHTKSTDVAKSDLDPSSVSYSSVIYTRKEEPTKTPGKFPQRKESTEDVYYVADEEIPQGSGTIKTVMPPSTRKQDTKATEVNSGSYYYISDDKFGH